MLACKSVLTRAAPTVPVSSTTLSKDASLLLTTTLDSKVHLIDLASGEQLQAFEGHKNNDYRSKAAFGRGERVVVMGDEGGKLWVWNFETVSPSFRGWLLTSHPRVSMRFSSPSPIHHALSPIRHVVEG